MVKLSNLVGIISIILLIYWVFTFMAITVFGLRVFRENITETFYLSVFGILALMSGALIINIMLNLTLIAENRNQNGDFAGKSSSKTGKFIFLLSFPLLLGFLFGGDYLTSVKKEKMLIDSAGSLVEYNADRTDKLVNYSFCREWIEQTEETLYIFSQTDTHFPHVSVVVADTIDDGALAFLEISYSGYKITETKPATIEKKRYIFPTSKEERDYLHEIFCKHSRRARFVAEKGNYTLFYPYEKNGRTVVFRFSDYQRYGKIGS